MGILAYDSRKKYFDGVGAEIDTTSLEEVYKLAGLDYVVEKHPLFYEDGTPAEGCYGTRALMPNGDVVTMGHVGEQYTVLNNFEAFDFLRDVVGDGELKIEHAGVVNGGKSSFICASTEPMRILDDEIAPYICFINSFDGSSGVKALLTPVRVFCSNCESIATKRAQNKISIKHSTNVHSNLYMAQNVLFENTKYLEEIKATMEHLATIRMNRRQFADKLVVMVLQKMGLLDKDGERVEKKRNSDLVDRYREHMLACWSANDLGNYGNTAYAAIQAMLDFESHMIPARNAGNPETTFKRVIQGMVLTDFAIGLVQSGAIITL
jgi:phage/plasmid-like protein (TIGR03299 family)